MEDTAFQRLKKAMDDYFPDGKIKDFQIKAASRRLGAKPPEALCAMIARQVPLHVIQGFLGVRLGQDSFWNDFNKYWESLAVQASLNSALDVDSFKMLLEAGLPPKEIILTRTRDISPLYRYLMAAMMGFYGEMKALRELAERQLRENPFYFDHYKEHSANFPIDKKEVV